MVRLPVSGVEVEVRPPTGAEDILLMESEGTSLRAAVALLERVARPAGGGPPMWDRLPMADFEALLLTVRRNLIGELVSTDAGCPAERCGERVMIEFPVTELIEHARPAAKVRGVEATGEDSWLALTGRNARFRLPLVSDQLAAEQAARPTAVLAERTIRPYPAPASVLRRIEEAMEKLAPLHSQPMSAKCPVCGHEFQMGFDVVRFVLAELRNQASFVYEEVNLLARIYHWSEEAILALPSKRRLRYVELAGAAGVAG